MIVPAMQSGCPWSELTNAWPPNIKWCEEQVCSLVVEPANTWSNLAYVLIGLALWWLGRRRARPDGRLRIAFGQAELTVGVFSFAFHMSTSGVLQVLDFAAMYVFVGLTLSLNLVRLGWLAPAARVRAYVAGVVLMTALTVALRFTPFPIQALTPVLILATVASEIVLATRPPRARYAWFWASLALLVAGAVVSALDASRAWCDPHDHVLQGHALWHVLSALSLACAWRFYAQFGDALLGPSGIGPRVA